MLTPQISAPKLAQAIGLQTELFIKREDQNPFGSHKGRSIPLMIEKYADNGATSFVISSSGNAAIAATKYIAKRPDLALTVFVGENIDETKRMEILRFAQDDKVQVKQVANPKQSAFQMAKTSGVINLRQSTDDSALVGYKELARELAEIKNLSAVFIPTSSGTTAQGLYLGFQKLGVNPQIHIVQTTACHPMINKSKIKDQNTGCEPAVAKIDADELDPTAYSWRNDNAEKSLASAIVDKVAHRKNKILEILKNSQGNGWVATNDDIQNAIALTKQNENIDISPNSALALVGLRQALAHGCKFNGPVVIIITGR